MIRRMRASISGKSSGRKRAGQVEVVVEAVHGRCRGAAPTQPRLGNISLTACAITWAVNGITCTTDPHDLRRHGTTPSPRSLRSFHDIEIDDQDLHPWLAADPARVVPAAGLVLPPLSPFLIGSLALLRVGPLRRMCVFRVFGEIGSFMS